MIRSFGENGHLYLVWQLDVFWICARLLFHGRWFFSIW